MCCNRIWAKASLSHVNKEKNFILFLEQVSIGHISKSWSWERERDSQVLGRLGLSLGPILVRIWSVAELHLWWKAWDLDRWAPRSVKTWLSEGLKELGPNYPMLIVWFAELQWAWVTQNHPKNKGHQHCLYKIGFD